MIFSLDICHVAIPIVFPKCCNVRAGPGSIWLAGLTAEDTVYWCTVAMSPEPEHCQYCHQPPQSGSDAQAAGTRGSHEACHASHVTLSRDL